MFDSSLPPAYVDATTALPPPARHTLLPAIPRHATPSPELQALAYDAEALTQAERRAMLPTLPPPDETP